MSSTTTSAATAAPRTLPALYRFLLRSSRTTFKNDAHTMAAWRQYVRQKMPAQAQAAAAQGSDGTLSSQFVDEWLDVAKVLKMNVVQGVRKQGTEDVYRECSRPALSGFNLHFPDGFLDCSMDALSCPSPP